MYTAIVVLDRLLQLLQLAVLAYCLMSFFPALRTSGFFRTLGRFLDPIAAPFRALSAKIGEWTGLRLDFSLWLALVALRIAERVLIAVLL